MKQFPLASLRIRLMLLVLLALLPVFGLAFCNRYDQRQQSARAAQNQALQLAQRAVSEQRELIGTAHQFLLSLAQLAVVRGEGPIPCADFFAELLSQTSVYTNLGVLDTRGNVICSGVPLTALPNLGTRSYFERALEHQVTLGEFEIGALGSVPTINLAYPITDDAQVQGAVFASLDLTWFREFADTQEIPQASAFIITTRAGALGIDYPGLHPLDMRTVTTRTAPWYDAPDAQRIVEFADPDGVARVYAFVPLNHSGYVGIGIPSVFAYAEIDRLAVRDMGILFIVTGFALAAAWVFGDWFIVRRAHALLRATQRLATGDYSARTGQSYGVGELSQLARAFDQMAATLQQREREQKEATATLRRQTEELAAITRVSREVTSVLDLNQVLNLIVHIIAELSQSDASGVYFPDATGTLRLMACYGVSARMMEEINAVGIKLGEGAMGRAASEQQPVQIPDTEDHSGYPFSAIARAEGIRAILAVPMLRDDHVRGGIVLWHRQPRHFTASEVTFLQAIAQQCVNAVENARLLTEAEKRANYFAALYDTAHDITEQRDSSNLLEMVVERAIKLLGVPHGGLYLYDATRGDLELVVHKGYSLPLGTTRLRLGEGMAGRVAQTREPIIVDDYRTWEHRAPRFEGMPFSAQLQVPMLYGGELLGVLNVSELGDTTRRFTEEDARLLGLFANQAASAVHNARLLQETHTRAEQLALLYDAGLALNSILEPHTQLEYLIKIAMRVLKAERASFYRYDPAHNVVECQVSAGYAPETAERWRDLRVAVGDERNVAGWVATNGLPLNLPDVSADPRYVVIDPQVQSGLWMPVEHEHQLLGVFGVLSTRRNAFPPEAERLLALFANQAAVAIENTRLFTEAQSSLLLLTRLYQLSSEVLTATTVQEIAQFATKTLCDSFAADAAWLHLFDAHGTCEFSYGTGLNSPVNGDLVPRPDGFSVRVWRSGQPVIVANPALLHPTARAFGTQSAVVLPLRSEPTNLGALGLNYRQPRLFAEREIELLSLFANQVALAIRRVRLIVETQRRADQLTVLNRIASAINQPSHLDELLEVIRREIMAALPCDAFFIALYDPLTDELDYRIQVDEGVQTPPQRFPLRVGLSSYVITERKPLLIRDRANDPRFPVVPETLWGSMKPAQSWLGVPILIGDAVVGIVNVQSYTTQMYDEEEERLLVTIADQVAVAIQRARLFEETQQRLNEFRAMNEISTALRVAQTSAEMLPALLDATLRALDAPSGVALLYDSEHHTTGASAARGWLAEVEHPFQYPQEGIAKHVVTTGEPYVANEFQSDPLTREQAHGSIRPGWGGVCAPIRTAQEAIGVLVVSIPLPRTIQPGETRLVTTFAEMAGNAIHRATLNEQTERHLRRLNALHTIDTAISASLDLRVTLNILLGQTILQLGVDAADVLVRDPTTQTLEYAAGQGFRSSTLTRSRLRLDAGYPARAVLERRVIHCADLTAVDDPRAGLLAGERFVAYYAAPLISKGQFKGVLEIFHRAPHQASPEWMGFLDTLAEQTAIAVENATLFTSLQRSNLELALAYDSTIEGWSRALDMRDHETEGHTQRVAELTMRLARALDVPATDLINIRRGALLHDIGKMAISDRVLLKKGRLTKAEMDLLRQHPRYAYEMLSPIEYLSDALDIPYCHHEKWDGTGYPRGLRGEAIPLVARIFTVVDVWDALRSERPYRRAWKDKRVKDHLRLHAGMHFDPQIVGVFLRMVNTDEPVKREQ